MTAAGGFWHSGLNCMLDVDAYWDHSFDNDPADVLPGSSLVPCGLHKTNGRPRANNTAAAAVWAAPESGIGPPDATHSPWQNTSGFGQCAEFLRAACDPTSVFSQIPTMLAFNGSVKENPWPTLYVIRHDVIRHA